MRNQKVLRTVITALFAALSCVATIIIQIPMPATNGFINMGDAVVLLGAFLLGPIYGAAAGAVGSALADILTGYVHYAPATFIIKGLMALVAALIFKALKKKLGGSVLGGIVAEIIMILGYFLYAIVLYSDVLGAATSIPGNAIQGVFGLVVSIILYAALEKSHATDKLPQF